MLILIKKTKRVFFLILIFLSASFSQKIYAQYADSAFVEIAPAKVIVVEDKEHSPGKATLYSAVLPGLGQIYNKHYWKVPVIYAGAGVITYFAVDNYKTAQKYKKEFISRDNGNEPRLLEGYSNEGILNLYNTHQKNFELLLIVGSITYLVNILDAYVFAHLFSFTINDDLSMQFSPKINYIPQSYNIPQFTPGFQLNFYF